MKSYNDIRFQELKEGLYDPNIFKAFFLAGGRVLVKHFKFEVHLNWYRFKND